MDETYTIYRYFQNHDKEVVKEGVSKEEAKEHCSDPDSSSRTCTTKEGIARTKEKGNWFDGFEED